MNINGIKFLFLYVILLIICFNVKANPLVISCSKYCLVSNNFQPWVEIPNGEAKSLNSGLVIDNNKITTVCNGTSPFSCYRTNGVDPLKKIPDGDVRANDAIGGGQIVIDNNNVVTVCSPKSGKNSAFSCYISSNGNAWVAIPTGDAVGQLVSGGLAVDGNNVVTVCNDSTPLSCYRSQDGKPWSKIDYGDAASVPNSSLHMSNLVSNQNGLTVACDWAGLCYISSNGNAWAKIQGNSSQTPEVGDLTISNNGVITMCSNNYPSDFSCYQSDKGNQWKIIPKGDATNRVKKLSMVVDNNGVVTACDDGKYFNCYQSSHGQGWGKIQDNNVVGDFGTIVIDGSNNLVMCTWAFSTTNCYSSTNGKAWENISNGTMFGFIPIQGLATWPFNSNRGALSFSPA